MDLRALAHDKGVLDGVLQLTHVAGPGVVRNGRRGFFVQGSRRLPGLVRQLFHEVVHQGRDVLAASAQGRQLDGDDLSP